MNAFATLELITYAAVEKALRECKAAKACEPDRLGNDWYHEYADALIPILTKLYLTWYPDQVFPASFLESDRYIVSKMAAIC